VIALLGLVAQLTVVAHAPATARACEPIEVSVAVRVTGNVLPRIIAPVLAPFEILSSSSVPRTWRDPASPGALFAEYRYVVATDQVGPRTILPFEARLGTVAVQSGVLDIDVRAAPPGSAQPTVVARALVDTSLDVNLRSLAAPETVYVGQQANYEVAVFLNQTVRDRLKRNPTFFPPDIQSMLAYDIPSQSNATYAKAGSRCFDALVYQRAIFPLQAGRFVIPPAQLVYALPTSSGFFSREESHELPTDSAVVIAIDAPTTGRPADYQGAVGNVRLTARVDTARGRVGVPVLLTVRVSGTGNVKLFPRPVVDVAWAGVVRGEERVSIDTTVQRVRGAKEFDWVLTPKLAGELDVPPIRYSYFNPETRRYEVTATAPTHLSVGTGALAEADTARTEEVLTLRPRYRGPIGAPLQQRVPYWVLLMMVPIPALGARLRRRSARPVRTTTGGQRRSLGELARVSPSGPSLDPREVRRAYAGALAIRLGLSPEMLTRAGALARVLRRAGVTPALADDAERLMRQLDAAAYSQDPTLPADVAKRASELVESANREALTVGELGPRLGRRVGPILPMAIVALGLGLGVRSALARRVDDPAARFGDAVAAYARKDYTAAAAGFAAAAAAEPRAADAWANDGTAAWAAGDTAIAVVGWQRALRLEPLAADMRDRVQLAHPLAITSAGYVFPVSLNALFAVAGVCWIVCWMVVGVAAARSRRLWSASTIALAVSSALVLVVGYGAADRVSGRHVAIASTSVAVSVDPALGSERGTNVIVGEAVTTHEVQGPWTRITLDDGRAGWVESASLTPLSFDRRR
jgi:hypothetical protein